MIINWSVTTAPPHHFFLYPSETFFSLVHKSLLKVSIHFYKWLPDRYFYTFLQLDPWVRKIPWEGKGNPFHYTCLENSMDRGVWWATFQGVAKSWTQLSTTISRNIYNIFMAVSPFIYKFFGKKKKFFLFVFGFGFMRGSLTFRRRSILLNWVVIFETIY